MPPGSAQRNPLTPRFGPFNWVANRIRPKPAAAAPAYKPPVHRFGLQQERQQLGHDLLAATILAVIAWLFAELWEGFGKSPLLYTIELVRWIDGFVGYFIVPALTCLALAIIAYRGAWGANRRLHSVIKRHNHNARYRQEKLADRATLRAVAVIEYNFGGAHFDPAKPATWLQAVRRCISFALSWSALAYVLPISLTLAMFTNGAAMLTVYLLGVMRGGTRHGILLAAHSLFALRRCIVFGYGTYLVASLIV